MLEGNMTHENFCHWLDGFLQGKSTLTNEDLKTVRDNLSIAQGRQETLVDRASEVLDRASMTVPAAQRVIRENVSKTLPVVKKLTTMMARQISSQLEER